ncbi:hypothetical protein BLJ79_12255 [Arthrobacter sp. UCD-GKA]|nr:hypothetical protein BLJ79_12255 [Arthrobacter sp. UCD-GKA]
MHDPAPGVSPYMLPEYTADAWRALDENTRYGLLYDQGLRAWYAPEATAKRTAARAKARQTRRARMIREDVAARIAIGAPRPHDTAPLCWPATQTPPKE